MEREKIIVHHRHDPMYDDVSGRISSTALELVQMQISAPRPQKRSCPRNRIEATETTHTEFR
jgi:hypothetical protein